MQTTGMFSETCSTVLTRPLLSAAARTIASTPLSYSRWIREICSGRLFSSDRVMKLRSTFISLAAWSAPCLMLSHCSPVLPRTMRETS